MRVGLVCPYTWDVPGGVQAHVRDLGLRTRRMAEQTRRRIRQGAVSLLEQELSDEVLDELTTEHMRGSVSLEVAARTLAAAVRATSAG